MAHDVVCTVGNKSGQGVVEGTDTSDQPPDMCLGQFDHRGSIGEGPETIRKQPVAQPVTIWPGFDLQSASCGGRPQTRRDWTIPMSTNMQIRLRVEW